MPHDPRIAQAKIRASGGFEAGTYELITGFLSTFPRCRGAGGGSFSGGAVHSDRTADPKSLPSPSRTAAAEMQERIIGRLKDTALGTDKPPRMDARAGRRWVGSSSAAMGLNVAPSTASLHLIVRLTGAGSASRLRPVFATDEAIAPLLDSLLEQSRR